MRMVLFICSRRQLPKLIHLFFLLIGSNFRINFVLSDTHQMEKEGVVPDVIDKVPAAVVTVKYGSGAEVKMGNELTPTQVKDVPSQVSWPTESDTLYTLAMVDPDAPSRQNPKFREWHHWLVLNIPGNDISKGQALSEYVGAGPPKGTGLHR